VPYTVSASQCDGTCPAASVYTTTAYRANDGFETAIERGKIDCGGDSAQAWVLGSLQGAAATLSGGLTSEYWKVVDDSAYDDMQDQYSKLQQQFSSCIAKCENLITSENFNLVCCSLSFLRSTVNVEIEKLKQGLQRNELLTYLALGLIVLILVYILVQ
jgi:urease accessory protein UreF